LHSVCSLSYLTSLWISSILKIILISPVTIVLKNVRRGILVRCSRGTLYILQLIIAIVLKIELLGNKSKLVNILILILWNTLYLLNTKLIVIAKLTIELTIRIVLNQRCLIARNPSILLNISLIYSVNLRIIKEINIGMRINIKLMAIILNIC
jgi:hypothetical protein